MTYHSCRLFTSAVALLTMPRFAVAQPPAVDRTLATDSIVVGIIVGSVYGQLGPHLAEVALNPRQGRPWRVVLPDTTGRWAAFLAHFWTTTRGRRAQATDSVTNVLRIDAVSMHGDTLRVRFYVGGAFRCGTNWKGAGTFYQTKVARHSDFWGPPRTEPTDYEDSAPC